MELKPGATLTFSPPQPAFAGHAPGMSPYVHRWLDLRHRLTDPGGDAAPVSAQTEAALRDLIDSALGLDRGDGRLAPGSDLTATGSAP
ncbi:MAG: hypothetical protein Q4G14_05105 [Paracoccus sp. (in: a-proteobacteria)]|uniref:hypothetical protein n=1 Tax=Paracoccus sp. TaxID=267 RepID=UPI0026DF368A|nr:hypothetical protein [Paracoccus sp. (in: a-proteobacteria)]MDO5612604.1 hypothetical protein [Paracoccus sp. (in: a-proteobacteria)]